jgi:hypothetical protein
MRCDRARAIGAARRSGRHWVMPLFIACIIVLGVLVVVGAYWPR